MYRYETHMHTLPVSKCARVSVREALEFYREIGYAGVFITNHYVEAKTMPDATFEERINYYFADYEEGVEIGKEIGIDVFLGLEISLKGTDFLVYGLDKEWFLSHPEIEEMKKSVMLPFLRENGALVIQAHPFREAYYIDHIRLFPRCVDGVETYNASRKEFENRLALQYAENYGLLTFAGSDNHVGRKKDKLGGLCFDTPLTSERDLVARVKNGDINIFKLDNPYFSSEK